MTTIEETIDSMKKGTHHASNETKAETEDHGDFERATYGLSQLSCSTANNEDFYFVHHSDKEPHETGKEIKLPMPYPRFDMDMVYRKINRIPNAHFHHENFVSSNGCRENSNVESNAFRDSSRSFSNNSRQFAPQRPQSYSSPKGQYPLMYVGTNGIISLVISDEIVIETTIDRTLHIVSHGNFAMAMNGRGTASAVQHPLAQIVHGYTKVSAKFIAMNNKFAVLQSEAILFTMGHLHSGFLIKSNETYKAPIEVPLNVELFDLFNSEQDYSLQVFYSEIPEKSGGQCLDSCYEIARKATFEYLEDNTLRMNFHGMVITSRPNGDLRIDCRPRVIMCNPKKGTLMMRSPSIEMGVDEDEKAYVKLGSKRVHVSRSGMVVSDGNCVASMDHFGRIISCT